jgi:uncharacterized protein YaiL (DUF2058 family)
MSLRDALLAKGVVSKKDVRRVDQEQRIERKAAQGSKERKSDLERAQEAAQKAAEAEATARRLAEKKAREAAREAAERAEQLHQIIVANRIRARGPVRYCHRNLDGRTIGQISTSERVAWKLRCGEAAIAVQINRDDTVDYVVISAKAARRLQELAPDRVVAFVQDSTGLSDPAEAFFERTWETSLVPRRVREL